MQDQDEQLRLDIEMVKRRNDEILRKIDDLNKQNNEKKTILSLPSKLDTAKKHNTLDQDVIFEALEKMRDYISQSDKKTRDEIFKTHIDFDGKVKEKLDKNALLDIESKEYYFITISFRQIDRQYIPYN